MNRRTSTRHGQPGLSGPAAIAGAFLCLPCICIGSLIYMIFSLGQEIRDYESPSTKRRKEAEARQAEVDKITPKFLGPRLEGCLTIGREEGVPPEVVDNTQVVTSTKKGKFWKEGWKSTKNKRVKDQDIQMAGKPKIHRTDDQAQSPFFKLPLEIREQIYKEVLGGFVIHVHFLEDPRKGGPKRMGHSRHKRDSPVYCYCRELYHSTGTVQFWGKSNLLPILQSCRKIYSEAVEILYKDNTFDFDYLADVMRLSLVILPERMSLITDVTWRRIPGEMTYTLTPWLECRAPDFPCSCFTCFPKYKFPDTHVHDWISYTWVMRTVSAEEGIVTRRRPEGFMPGG